ncbi:MAG: serine/threonine-protein kinase [Chloroflexota bacterium]
MVAGPTDPPTLPARLADRYRLEERIADGGSAEVWLARDTVLDRPVAIKVLHRHLLSDAVMRARLEQEARAAAGLTHPGIVTVHDVDVDEGAAAVVLEFVDGESLAERIRRDGPLPAAEAVRIAAEVAEALDHAHEGGVIHRDVKPGNVLIEQDGRARLVDFGIARVMDDAENRLTTTGTIAGTLRYLAPELLRGETSGAAVDVYGVGAILAEMLTGRPPYEVDSPLVLAEAQRMAPPLIAGIAPDLAEIVQRCLDPDPARRPPSAAALATELRDWLSRTVDPDARTSAYETVGGAGAAAAVAADAGLTTDAALAMGPMTAVEPPTSIMPTTPAIESVAADDPRRDERVDRGRPIWPLLAAIVAIPLVVILAASLFGSHAVTSSPSATARASSNAVAAGEPTAKPAKTAVLAVKPKTLPAAVAAFGDEVDAGEKDGSIDAKAADDLRRRADDIAKKPPGPKHDDTSKKIDDLRGKIDEFERNGKIVSAAVANRLRAAVDAIDSTSNG